MSFASLLQIVRRSLGYCSQMMLLVMIQPGAYYPEMEPGDEASIVDCSLIGCKHLEEPRG